MPVRGLLHRRVSSPLVLGTCVILWLLAVGVGMAVLWDYESAPGAAAAPPIRWPEDSGLARAHDHPTLVMFLHPRCPCSRASVDELARLLPHATDALAVHALFLAPAEASSTWVVTDLWRTAAAIPGVRVARDPGGGLAARFGVATSGQVLLYDAGGRLAFSGGITTGRGHAGDSVGAAAILARLVGTGAAPDVTPVYGCALRAPGGA